MQFREAVPEDIERIVKLVESAYRGDSSRQGWTTEADLLGGQRTDQEEIAELLSDDSSKILLAIDQLDIKACVNLKKLKQASSCSYLGMFAVNPAEQGKGIGKQLLHFSEDFVRNNWHCEKIEMTVIRQRPELIAWYEKHGYYKTGEQREFPYGDERFGLPKRDDLVMVVLEKTLAK